MNFNSKQKEQGTLICFSLSVLSLLHGESKLALVLFLSGLLLVRSYANGQPIRQHSRFMDTMAGFYIMGELAGCGLWILWSQLSGSNLNRRSSSHTIAAAITAAAA